MVDYCGIRNFFVLILALLEEREVSHNHRLEDEKAILKPGSLISVLFVENINNFPI